MKFYIHLYTLTWQCFIFFRCSIRQQHNYSVRRDVA